MNIRSLISRYTPEVVKKKIREKISQNEIHSLESLDKVEFNLDNLKKDIDFNLNDIFESKNIEESWNIVNNQINQFNLPDGTGGVNPGDRRAIFYLIKHFKPQSVLEIGTHIGASTIHIALALMNNENDQVREKKLITVDIRDVNSSLEKHWLEYGSSNSPLEMVQKLGLENVVSFKTKDSIKFMQETTQKFDFIFLDGSHNASDVYEEVPAALKLLEQNGIILLHDYFPSDQPLWSNKPPISGPYLAIERLKNEGADLVTIPLGSLPWGTQLNSNVTSLALLMRE